MSILTRKANLMFGTRAAHLGPQGAREGVADMFAHNTRKQSHSMGGQILGGALLISVAMSPAPSMAANFECPQDNDLRTSPLDADLLRVLPKGVTLSQPSQLASAVALMREHGVPPYSTIDHLIALYCPTVASNLSLSNDQKTSRVRQFATSATRLVLTNDSETGVIFDVELKPDVAEEASQRAAQAGLTVEQWMTQVIEAGVR